MKHKIYEIDLIEHSYHFFVWKNKISKYIDWQSFLGGGLFRTSQSGVLGIVKLRETSISFKIFQTRLFVFFKYL